MGHMPKGDKFASKKQWKWAFASHQSWAHSVAHHSSSYKSLPASKRTVQAKRRG
jgi:hypothetical protein